MTDCHCHSHSGFLTRRGYRLVAQRRPVVHGVDCMATSRYLDKSGSVSALIEIENDYDYDPRHIELNRVGSALLQLEMF